ncbi:MAG: L,D-transpeptidase [Flavobacteriales bacterium]
MRTFLLSLPLLLLPGLAQAQGDDLAMAHTRPPKQDVMDFMLEYLEVRYPGTSLTPSVLYVSVKGQHLYHVWNGTLQHEYAISTARNGLGEQRDSFRTPNGLHRITEKIGAGVPQGGIFTERRFTGHVLRGDSIGPDLITSRILWLDGLEPGVNQGGHVDSHARSIYIHGTGDEGSIGQPSSHGCIRMRNADVVELFDRVEPGTIVVILDN